jgi:nucleoside phosphorylase/tetratricopeptide (TPR) repeat protein
VEKSLKTDILLVTVTDIERDSVFSAVVEHTDNQVNIGQHGQIRTYFDLGHIEGAQVSLLQVEMGSTTPGGSLSSISEAIRELQPRSIIMVGIAFGVDAKKQNIGDVLVAKQIQAYEIQRIGLNLDDVPQVRTRGDKASSSTQLISRLRASSALLRDPKVHFGLVLSGEKLIDNLDFRDSLLALESEAIGGEMEGAGLYASAHDRSVEWILVKGICDWADGKKYKNKKQRQEKAALAAAKFVILTLKNGGFVDSSQRHSYNKVASPVIGNDAENKLGKQSIISNLPKKGRKWKLVGRKNEINKVNSFLSNEEEHFLFIYGLGGVGKTHLIENVLRNFDTGRVVYISCSRHFSMEAFFSKLGLPFDSSSDFVSELSQLNLTIALDNFQDVIDDDFIKKLGCIVRSLYKGKVILISRTTPKSISNIEGFDFDYEKLNIQPIRDSIDKVSLIEEFSNVMLSGLGIGLSLEEKTLLADASAGYPILAKLLVKSCSVNDLNLVLEDISYFNMKEEKKNGEEWCSRVISHLLKRECRKEMELLLDLSIFEGEEIPIELVELLPSYNREVLLTLIRKFFIKSIRGGNYRVFSHPLIREISSGKAQMNARKVKHICHIILGYYERKILKEIAIQDLLSSEIMDAMPYLYRSSQKVKKRFIARISPYVGNLETLYRDSLARYISQLERALRRTNKSYEYYFLLGITLRENAQFCKSIEYFKLGMRHVPFYTAFHSQISITYRANNQLAEAINILVRGIEIDPSNPALYNELGITYRANNQLEEAIDILVRGIEIDRFNSFLYNELGITYRANNQLEEAINILVRGIEIDPSNPALYNELGITYRANNQLEESIDILVRGIEIDPSHSLLYNVLGITYRANNQLEEAINILVRGIEIDPSNPALYNELGITYRANNQLEEAIDVLENSLSICLEYSVCRTTLLDTFVFFEGDSRKASNLIEKYGVSGSKKSRFIESILEGDLQLINEKVGINKTKMRKYLHYCIELQSFHKARSVLELLLEQDKSNPRYNLAMGKTLNLLGDLEHSRVYLLEASRLYQKSEKRDECLLLYLRNLVFSDVDFSILQDEVEKFQADLDSSPQFHFFLYQNASKLNIIESKAINHLNRAVELAYGRRRNNKRNMKRYEYYKRVQDTI